MLTLSKALKEDCAREVMRAACDLRFAASDYASARTASSIVLLDQALAAFAAVIDGWRSLVPVPRIMRMTWGWHPRHDDWENAMHRLMQHGVSLGLWRLRWRDSDRYFAVREKREAAFYAAARQLPWAGTTLKETHQ